MPKLAANLMCMFTELPFFERFEVAQRAGFRYIEYQFPYDQDASKIRDTLARTGLSMALINAPCGDRTAGERGIAALPGCEEEFRDSFLEALAYARELGCPLFHVMSGLIPDGEEDIAMSVYAEKLRVAAITAEAAGIGVVVEPLNGIDVPGYLIQRTAQARALLAMIGQPNLFLQYDAYHALMNGEDPIEGLRANLDIIRHIQIAGYPGRNEPFGSNEYDIGPFLEVCDMLGYAGAIGCEYNPKVSTEAGLSWASRYGIGF